MSRVGSNIPPVPPGFERPDPNGTYQSEPADPPTRRGRWKVVPAGLLVFGGLIVAGALFGGEASTAPWEVGSCVSAADSDQVARSGDEMVAVKCNEANEGQIIGVAASADRCPPAADFIVGRDGAGEIFCVQARGVPTR